MLGYAPFLGQIGYRAALGQFDDTSFLRSSRVQSRNVALKNMLDFYSPWYTNFDAATTSRLEAKIETCRAAILKIMTDPDVDVATVAADSCTDDLQRMLQNARSAYFNSKAATASDVAGVGALGVGALVVASVAFSAYHGYKRNNSVGWGIGWGALGLFFPIITPAVAVIQGYGKRAK
jgi:hypothetical protein